MTNIVKDIKMVSGIDTLYFFMESIENYEELFLELLDQCQDSMDRFTRNEVSYKNEDIYCPYLSRQLSPFSSLIQKKPH